MSTLYKRKNSSLEDHSSWSEFPMWPVDFPRSVGVMTGTPEVHLSGLLLGSDMRQKNKIPVWFQSSHKEHSTELWKFVECKTIIFQYKKMLFSIRCKNRTLRTTIIMDSHPHPVFSKTDLFHFG